MSLRRMLLVHAHPDDESITCGATIARYAAAGVEVTLLTCTLGEEGEILAPELARLAADQADQLGGYRLGELCVAMRALGVTDHRFLGGAGRFRDSGMMGSPSNDHSRAFWRASKDPDVFDAAVAEVVAVIREVRPHVVVTYDELGDYGHPDHIMAHRVTTAAVQRAADPDHGHASEGGLDPGGEHGRGYGHGKADSAAWEVPKVYWTAAPRSALAREFDAVRSRHDLDFTVASVEELPFGVDDEVITTAVDVSGFVEAKLDALAAHRTQVIVARPFYALSNMLGRYVGPTEYFRLAQGILGGDRDAEGWERDLFAGLTGGPS